MYEYLHIYEKVHNKLASPWTNNDHLSLNIFTNTKISTSNELKRIQISSQVA